MHRIRLALPRLSYSNFLDGRDYVVAGPVQINLIVGGAEISTRALVAADTAFPEQLVVGKHKISATGFNSQQYADGTIALDEDSTILLAPFLSTKGHQMMKGLVDTGAGRSIKGITAWNKLGLSEVVMQSKHTNLVAVNGKLITTYGLAESVAFKLAGIALESSFVIEQGLP